MVAVDLTIALATASAVKQNANAQVDDRRSAPLKESVITTWRAILKITHQMLRSALSQADDQGNFVFMVENGKLAKMAGVSVRTVIRHRQILQEAQLIAYHRWRGSQHPYLLAIPPKMLGILQPLDGSAIASRIAELEAQASEFSSGDILSPLPEDREYQDTKAPVEKGGPASPAQVVAGSAPPMEGDDESQDSQDGHRQAEGWKHGGTEDARKIASEDDKAPPQRRKELAGRDGTGGGLGAPAGRKSAFMERWQERQALAYADELWKFAQKTLWPGLPIRPEQAQSALESIRGYYRNVLAGGHLAREWHDAFIAMIQAARRYLDRDPRDSLGHELARLKGGLATGGGGSSPKRRFIPNPDVWFSPDFPHGFKGCYPWILKRRRAIEAAQAEAALIQAYNDWHGNQRRPPSKRRDEIELYREITDRLSLLRNQDVMTRWTLIVSGLGGMKGGNHG